MEKRKLGASDLNVPVICLGTNVYGWTLPEAEALKQLDAAVDAGLNFIDTADLYSRWAPGHKGGESETIIGKWLAQGGRRKDVIVATKVGMDMGDGKKGLKQAYLRQAVEASLRRLQTDYIDLYQAHQDDKETSLEETLRAFDALAEEGKIRFAGASNYSGARLAEAMDISQRLGLRGYISLQPHYNLVERQEFETELLTAVETYNLGVIPYFSLAAGFLTGKYQSKQDADGKPRENRVKHYLNDRGLGVVAALKEIARAHNATPARVALAWLIAQPGVTAPIASATSEKHLHDLIEATKLRLDPASIERLNQVSSPQVPIEAQL